MHVMKHVQANSTRELSIVQRHGGGVSLNNGHIAFAKPGRQRAGESRVDLEGGYARQAGTQQVRGKPVARSQLQDVISKLDVG
jgi:hypothetical protein